MPHYASSLLYLKLSGERLRKLEIMKARYTIFLVKVPGNQFEIPLYVYFQPGPLHS